jgi:hypothetical protein
MRKTTYLLVIVLFTLISTRAFCQTNKSPNSYFNYGNWTTNPSNNNIGIGVLPSSVGKLEIIQSYYNDWLRFIPAAHQQEGVWRFHNPLDERYLHIGWHDNTINKDYWNLTLTPNNSRVGINDITPEANLDVNGSVYFHVGDKPYLSVSNGEIIIGSKDNNLITNFNGKINANEIEVSLNSWPDNVFMPEYKLMTLSEVEQFIKKHKHLPEIPSESEVIENGVELGDMNAKLLQKVEEPTLYVIDLKKEVEKLKTQQSTTSTKQN